MASVSLDEAVQLFGTLRHFFEVAVHAILFYRRLYPERAFATAAAFDLPVHQSRHPAVCAWVRAAVDQVMVQIANGASAVDDPGAAGDRGPSINRVHAVAVVVHAPFRTAGGALAQDRLPAGAVLERWVFDVRHLPRGWPGGIAALQRALRQDQREGEGRREREGAHEDAQDRKETRQRRQQASPEKVAPEFDDDRDDDVVRGEARYDYYDEEEELANAESEAELGTDDEEYAKDGGREDGNDPTGPAAEEADDSCGAVNWTDLDDQLRGVLQRLAQAGQQLAALPSGCTFTMAIELGEPPEEGTGRAGREDAAWRDVDANWIPETGSGPRQPVRAFGGRPAGSGASTTAIRSVDCAPLFLECWVEESAVKQAAASSDAGENLPPPPAVSNTSLSLDKSGDSGSTKGKTVSFA